MQSRLATSVFVLALLLMSSVILYFTKDIMIPFVLSLFLVYTIQPAIRFFQKRFKINRSIALPIVLILVVVGFVIIFAAVGHSLRQIAANSEQYQAKVLRALDLVTNFVNDSGILADETPDLRELVSSLPIFGFLSKISGAIFNGISDFTLIAIFSLFLMTGKQIGIPKDGLIEKANQSVRGYLTTKLLTSLATGSLTAIFFFIVDLEMAFMFGLLAFLLNFIPTIGSIFATLLPLPIALLQFSNPTLIVLSLVIPGSIQFIIGNVIEPKIIGQNLDLHPITILLSLMFWGILWGIPGMFLATPITVICRLFLANSTRYEGFAELMSGRIKF
ncbi:MAG: AI-2E family transporter [Pseudobacteriovorax sp.]|nr:AI-2E family transporter [Pseudobacteriovorax sp.]